MKPKQTWDLDMQQLRMGPGLLFHSRDSYSEIWLLSEYLKGLPGTCGLWRVPVGSWKGIKSHHALWSLMFCLVYRQGYGLWCYVNLFSFICVDVWNRGFTYELPWVYVSPSCTWWIEGHPTGLDAIFIAPRQNFAIVLARYLRLRG